MMQKKDIPNAICWFRIALIPLVLLFLIPNSISYMLIPYHTSILISGILFTIAMVSDFVDGKIARKYNFVSDLGKFLDPIADKMLVLAVCVAFAGIGTFKNATILVSVIAILLRELMISGLRLSAASHGNVVAANWWGKIKTTLQGVSIFATYICLYIYHFYGTNVINIQGVQFEISPVGYLLLIPEILFAINGIYAWISAIPYIKACAPYLKG